MLAAELVVFKSHPGGFEGMQGSWRAAEARHCERSGKVIGEAGPSVAIEDPGLEMSSIRS